MLTLNKNPIFTVRKQSTQKQLQKGWKEFYILAKEFHSKYQNKHGYKRALAGEFDAKGELYALINPTDFNKFEEVTNHFLGSRLEITAKAEIQGETKHVVHALGYWNCIGS